CGVRAVRFERLAVLIQRMAGKVEAENFLFALGKFLGGKFRNIGQRAGRRGRFFLFETAEQRLLPSLAIGGQRLARLDCPLEHCEQLRSPGAKAVEGTGTNERFDYAARRPGRIDSLAEVEQILERPAR